jgi:exonuclease III
MRNKCSELFGSLFPELPHILCLTEHFLTKQEITSLSIDHYKLGEKFCRKVLNKGGSCIYAHESLNFHNINLQKFCTEQDIEACAIEINLLVSSIYILSVYRSPKGNFRQFLKGIDNILNYFSKFNTEIIICGDVNINYLAENCNKRQQLDNLLATYNLVSTIEFPTRTANGCTSIIDNIYIDKIHTWRYIAFPVILVYQIMMPN